MSDKSCGTCGCLAINLSEGESYCSCGDKAFDYFCNDGENCPFWFPDTGEDWLTDDETFED